jgi:hypothetical protein
MGLKINSHSVFKIPNVLRVFVNRLCEVIFEPSRIFKTRLEKEDLWVELLK